VCVDSFIIASINVLYSILIMKLRVHKVSTVLRKQLSVVVSGDCSTEAAEGVGSN